MVRYFFSLILKKQVFQEKFMIVQILIIGVVLAAGGILFSSEIHDLFPQEIESVTTSIKNDVSGFSSKTVNLFENSLEQSSGVIKNNMDSPIDMIESSKDSLSEKILNITP